jgi:phage gp29-like protein
MMMGEELPDKKFLLPRRNPTYKNPYGDALLSKCYWPMLFKRNGTKFWITFIEKYGTPFFIGKLSRNAPDTDYAKLRDDLENMVTDAVAAIPDDASLEIMEPAGKSASSDIFKALCDWANSEVSKAIIGHTGGSDSTPGKLGSENAAIEVRKHLIEEDKRLVESTMNQLLRWIHEINFGQGEPPSFVLYAEEDVGREQAEIDKLLYDMGARFSIDYLSRRYDKEPGDITAIADSSPTPPPIGGKPKPGNFAEKKSSPYPDQDAIDTMIEASLTPEEVKKDLAFSNQIITAFSETGNYEEAMKKCFELFPDLDTDAAQAKVANLIFLGETWGRLHAKD